MLGRTSRSACPIAVGLGHARSSPPPRSASPAPSGGSPSATTGAPGADRARLIRSSTSRGSPRPFVVHAQGRPGAAPARGGAWPSPASTCRSSAARWSATSARTAPGSRPPSRCSPASSCRRPGHVRVDGLEPSRPAHRAGPSHRRGVRPALAAVVGPAAARQLRPAAPRLPRARPSATPRTSAASPTGSTSGPLLDVPVRQLSLGQRMRGELTAALLHDPSILLLDEPTIGLDVVSKEAVREFLVEINREQGTTVLLTTHDLADVERLCERLLIIDHGTRDRGRHRRRDHGALRHRAHARRRPRRAGAAARDRRAPRSHGSTGPASGCGSGATT